jgi:predicted RNA binding protein YcfA (HicA-like mRNA interferase family)
MYPSCRELIEQLKSDKKNRTFQELQRMLEANGFVMHPRSGGSHRVFTRPGLSTRVVLIEGADPVLAAYVRGVIRALEECCDEW